MLESDSESAKNLCWRRQIVPKTLGTPLSDLATGGTVASHGEEGEGSEKLPDTEEVRESEPLAVVLVNAMFHLLFLPEFTIEDPKIDFNEVRAIVTVLLFISFILLYFHFRPIFIIFFTPLLFFNPANFSHS